MTAEGELMKDLDLAESWFEEDIRHAAHPERARQLRYSLCNKLASDWQKYVKAKCRSVNVATTGLGNCWPRQVRRAFSAAGRSDPFREIDVATLGIFDALNPVRNAIDHGDEPRKPSNEDFMSWIEGLRAIAQVGLV